MSNRSVFISYGREDLEKARRLYNDLLSAGYQPWLDVFQLRPGEQWVHAIRKAVRDSRFFIPLLSSNTVSRRGFVHKELVQALEVLDMFSESDIYLIPVRLDACEPSHERLRDLQWVDMFPEWSTGLAKIISSLSSV